MFARLQRVCPDRRQFFSVLLVDQKPLVVELVVDPHNHIISSINSTHVSSVFWLLLPLLLFCGTRHTHNSTADNFDSAISVLGLIFSSDAFCKRKPPLLVNNERLCCYCVESQCKHVVENLPRQFGRSKRAPFGTTRGGGGKMPKKGLAILKILAGGRFCMDPPNAIPSTNPLPPISTQNWKWQFSKNNFVNTNLSGKQGWSC